MTHEDHQGFAADLLSSLRDDGPETEVVSFVPNPRQSRSAARAMAAILCHRLFKNSRQRPIQKKDRIYEWKQGTFDSRNITDRAYFWTNMRPAVASEMHATAESKPVAYVLACCKPEGTTMSAWAIPEPLMHASLASLRCEESGQKYSVQIFAEKQRIERCGESPDLTPYYQQFELRQNEMRLLKESRAMDVSVKRERATAHAETAEALTTAEKQLSELGFFDPEGIADARDRVLSSIVRRRGQPAFRRNLLAAYDGRCAVTECAVECVLDAAHIVPYMGPETNHPSNGLLLRTDLHTLFDLKLLAVDVETMTLLVSPELSDTFYWEYHGEPIRVPDGRESRPSRKALKQHRRESGL